MSARGQFAVVRTSGIVARLIRLVTRSKWNHAFLLLDDNLYVEANPSGATYGRSPYAIQELSNLDLSPAQADQIHTAALGLVGTPYGFLDILSIGLLQYGIKPGFVRRRVARSDRLICSQLVAEAYRRAGVCLFSDARLPMDVTPGDLDRLINAPIHADTAR